MLKYTSHISVIGLAAAIVAGCHVGDDKAPSRRDEKSMLVSPDYYSKAACWNHKGSFRAFLVLAKNGNYAVPDFVSVNCVVNDKSMDAAEAVIFHLGTILMLDSNGAIQGKFPSLRIGGNVASDQPLPSASSKVYYFEADLDRISHPYKTVYAPRKIKKLIDINTSFREFLMLSPVQREELLRSIRD
jgi:hypothetical protein